MFTIFTLHTGSVHKEEGLKVLKYEQKNICSEQRTAQSFVLTRVSIKLSLKRPSLFNYVSEQLSSHNASTHERPLAAFISFSSFLKYV
jgi:hypothetical protein